MPAAYSKARSTLYHILSGWTFCTVLREPTIPPSGVDDNGRITFYHFMCKSLTNKKSKVKFQRVWCKQSGMSKLPLKIGPVSFPPPDSEHMPKAGDLIMGKVVEKKTKNTSSSETSKSWKRYELVTWLANADAVYELYKLIVYGTAKRELAHAHLLRFYNHGSPVDDIWALVRLVLYKNIQLFVTLCRDAITPHEKGRDMILSCAAEEFVYRCAIHLFESRIWDDFVTLTPDWKDKTPCLNDPATTMNMNIHTESQQTHDTPENMSPPAAVTVLSQVLSYMNTRSTSTTTATTVQVEPADLLSESDTSAQYSAYMPYAPYTDYQAYREYAEGAKDMDWSGPRCPRSPKSPSYTPCTPDPNSPGYSPNTPPPYSPRSPKSPSYTPCTPDPNSPGYSPNTPPPYSPRSPKLLQNEQSH